MFQRAESFAADLLIVHHGLFWDGDSRVVDALMRRRLETLFRTGITLAAYHLPLDAHRELGNNAELARMLGVAPGGLVHGRPRSAARGAGTTGRAALARGARGQLEGRDGTPAARVPGGPEPIRTVGICSGGAARGIRLAASLGLDAWITGEPAEDSRALASELGISFVAGGHYATETFGVRALASVLQRRFGVETTFLDVPNPV